MTSWQGFWTKRQQPVADGRLEHVDHEIVLLKITSADRKKRNFKKFSREDALRMLRSNPGEYGFGGSAGGDHEFIPRPPSRGLFSRLKRNLRVLVSTLL
jgi:hypothetical protein